MLKKNKNKGFGLMEMLVAMTVFSLTIIIAMGAYLNINASQKQSMSIRTLNDNLNFAFEVMTREIMEGSNYSNPGGNTSVFNFTNFNGCSVTYSIVGNRLKRNESGGSGCNNPDRNLTSSEIMINYIRFTISGGGSGDTFQARVTININASINPSIGLSMVGPFNIQTTVSQRQLDS
ncbi:MAG: prepilin-type N-terminal cleavage/methylation domain-containing protein [Patescibacteria group bacterium]